MSDRHVRGNPGEEPEAAPPRTRRRLPLRIAEVREVQAPPAPTPNSVRFIFCMMVELSDASGQYGQSLQVRWPIH